MTDFESLQLALKGDPDGALALLETDLAQLDPLLAKQPQADALTVRGLLSFVRGDYAGALAGFDAAHQAARKATRKRNILLPGLAGVLHLLALLRRGKPEDISLAQKQVDIALRARDADYLHPVYRIIGELANLLAGQCQPSDCFLLYSLSATRDPLMRLFQGLAAHWIGERLDQSSLSSLARLAQIAARGGQPWYANEAVALLKRVKFDGELPVLDLIPRELVTMTELLQPKPNWERALDALARLKPDQRAVGETQSPSALRLIWLLIIHSQWASLEPREQKRTKAGSWTRGRAVGLQRLAEDVGTMPHLTAQDRAITACIVREESYGYYGRTTYHLDSDRALMAAVGHPLLFTSLDDSSPIELVSAAPTLKVSKRRQDILVQILPFPEEARPALPIKEATRRVRLVEFKPEHKQIGAILGQDGLSVPKGASSRLLKSLTAVAPMVTVHSDIGGVDGSDDAKMVPADTRPHFHLKPVDDGISLELFMHPFGDAGGGPHLRPGEGSANLFTEISGRALRCTRKLKDERSQARELIARCPTLEAETADNSPWSWQLEDPENALSALEQLHALGDAVVLDWPKGKRIGLTPAADLAQVRPKVSSQQDWLDLGGALHLPDGRVLELRELLAAATNSRFVRLGERDFLTLSEALRKRLEGLRGLTDGGRFHPLAAPAIAELIDGMQVEASKEWKQRLAHLAEARELEPKIPSTLQAELREYQIDGYRWLARLAHWGAGACLADDMGLGKTVQALGLILSRAPEGPTLVLAPTSVCGNWLEETARFAPTLNPLRFGSGDRAAMLEQAGPFDLIVVSYGLLQTEGKRLAKANWQTIVADEAQAFKNARTLRSQAIMQLKGAFRVITTGTPIENHLGELWNLFRFINPGLLGSLESFNARFANPIEQHQDRDARARLRQLLRPFILRRLKSEVLSELPSRTEITLTVELSDSEKALYEAVRQEAIDRLANAEATANPGQQRMQLLAEIMRLRRACCHPRLALPDSPLPGSKLDAFAEMVEELLENRHKALVFSQFVDHLQIIREHLDSRGIHYQYLDGSTPEPKRRAAVTAFQSGEGDLFLISLRAGGSGLNLTAADYVIHMDPWWNPAVEDQASDRAHRIGQERPVTIYRLVAKDTIEERILKLHASKRDLADALLEGTDDSSRLSYTEMLALVRDGGLAG
ncbi:DEAD/DEAH box helicase [Thiorhodovibrio frisius]|uniref:DNA/RNA helicase, superfamily II, SNF2 family n=1 Tax=Thiorhodovibrio frisius TaxID=631362 RepID=H8YY54_9GAMM|nr:DEAD/DEAH box helicase [Thiorhodovibrio frisius]EIC23380.1 DNA/RNA helicase, superfamily II, SNF2 family [Thiorhodovibrio frisius]WPL23539.1 ATP-dependent helicase HepA [Thiorhodovibrio frisius]